MNADMHSAVDDRPFGQLAPLHVLRGRLGGRVRISEVNFPEPVSLYLRATPLFPGSAPPGANPDAVWDLDELLQSVRRPGTYELFTCTCSVASCAGIYGRVHVSHPDPEHVVWELSPRTMRAVLDPILAYKPDGFLRWVFGRRDYDSGARQLLHELQQAGRQLWRVGDMPDDLEGLDHLYRDHADLAALPVGTLQPDGRGLTLEKLLALDPEADWTPEPLCAAGTRIEVGIFPEGERDELLRIDGSCDPGWMGRFFTRYEVDQRFRDWVAHLEFAYQHKARLPGVSPYRRVLRREADRAPCHATGRAFADILAASLREGHTAAAVEVRYVERAL